jgi:outer membrane protein TolC
VATHPALRAATARVDIAEAVGERSRSLLRPSLTGSLALTHFAEPMVVAPLHRFDPMSPPTFDRTLIQSQLGAFYTLFDGGARQARVRDADAMEAGASALREAAEMDVLADVVGAFTRLLWARQLGDAAARHVDALSSAFAVAERRFQEGAVPQIEVLRAEGSLLDGRAALESAVARTVVAERSLERTMGLDPGALAARPLADIAPRDAMAGEAGSSPTVEAAMRAADAARARLGLERAARAPSIEVGAGIQNFGSGGGDFVTEWQTGVKVSWPLLTGGARPAAIHRAEAELAVAQAVVRGAELRVAAALVEALAALTESRGRSRALEASVIRWEGVARIEALRLEEGVGLQQDYLSAEAALFTARAELARARYDEILAHVGLAHALGSLDRAWIETMLEVRP